VPTMPDSPDEGWETATPAAIEAPCHDDEGALTGQFNGIPETARVVHGYGVPTRSEGGAVRVGYLWRNSYD
jgi:hypothetical protein